MKAPPTKKWLKRGLVFLLGLATAAYLFPIGLGIAIIAFLLVLLTFSFPLKRTKRSKSMPPDRFRDSLRTAEQVLGKVS